MDERTNGFILILGLEEIVMLSISCNVDLKKSILEHIRCLFLVSEGSDSVYLFLFQSLAPLSGTGNFALKLLMPTGK